MKLGIMLAVALAVVLTPACAPPECGGAYHFHESFPLAWRDDVRIAAERWNAFGIHKVLIVDEDEDDTVCSFRVVAGESDEYRRLSPKHAGDHWAGISRTYDSSIVLCPDHWGTAFTAGGGHLGAQDIIMHEIGHVFGLEHVSGAPAVMAPDQGAPIVEYTPADRAECERVWACVKGAM